MRFKYSSMYLLVALLFGQINARTQISSFGFERRKPAQIDQSSQLAFISPEYREQAIKMLIVEANKVAYALRLSEKLPITETDLLASYVSPPGMAKRVPAFGNITTSNYIYYCTIGNKFSFLERTHFAEEQAQLEKQYHWPINRFDTNSAYQLSTEFLAAVSIDVAALNRECAIHIDAPLMNRARGEFVPLYLVYWMKPGIVGSRAEIELFLPTRTLMQMHVMDSKYILRKSLKVPNAELLLSQTNSALKTNAPP
jgi:hypothetical protein